VGIIELAIMAVMVIFNGVFAGYEIALATVTLARLQILVRENRAGAKAALYMKQNMEASLAAVQVAITALGALAAAVGGVGAAESIKPFLQSALNLSPTTSEIFAILVIVLPLTIFTILFGELIPKVFSIRNKEWVCLRLSPVMRWFCFSVWPAVRPFEKAVLWIMEWSERLWRPRMEGSAKREATELLELRAHAASARALRLIGEREENIILGAARFSSRTVREIMLPAENISMLDVKASLGESLIVAHLDMHTRFPVAERPGDPQSILGYVNFKDLIALMRLSLPHQVSLRAVLRPLPSLPADMMLASCLERVIHEHTHIALVCDEGKVVGMVTLEDVLEELVGEIQDEYDRLPVHAVPSGWGWVVGGGMTIARLKELTGIDLAADPLPNMSEGEAKNVSDWIVGHFEGFVHGGETLERNGLRVIVRKVRRQKVFECQMGHVDAPPKDDQPGDETA